MALAPSKYCQMPASWIWPIASSTFPRKSVLHPGACEKALAFALDSLGYSFARNSRPEAGLPTRTYSTCSRPFRLPRSRRMHRPSERDESWRSLPRDAARAQCSCRGSLVRERAYGRVEPPEALPFKGPRTCILTLCRPPGHRRHGHLTSMPERLGTGSRRGEKVVLCAFFASLGLSISASLALLLSLASRWGCQPDLARNL